MSELSLKQKNFKQVLFFASKSRSKYEQIKDKRGLLCVLCYTPLAYIQLKEKELCLNECKAGLRLVREVRKKSVLNAFFTHLALVLIELGFLEQAQELATDLFTQKSTEKQHKALLRTVLSEHFEWMEGCFQEQTAKIELSEEQESQKINSWRERLEALFSEAN